MIFYHGSKTTIKDVKYKGSRPNNDYGPCFYVTTDFDAARLWATKSDDIGVVNEYKIDDEVFKGLKILDLAQKNKESLITWLAILMHFREVGTKFKTLYKTRFDWLEKHYIDVDQYDVIKGFRADDSYFSFPRQFISDRLSFENLYKVFMLGNLGIQYAFVSNKAIKALKFHKAQECHNDSYFNYENLVNEANRQYQMIITEPLNENETFMRDLIKNDIK